MKHESAFIVSELPFVNIAQIHQNGSRDRCIPVFHLEIKQGTYHLRGKRQVTGNHRFTGCEKTAEARETVTEQHYGYNPCAIPVCIREAIIDSLSLNSEVEDRKNVLLFLQQQVAYKKSNFAEFGLAPFKVLIPDEIDFFSKDNIGIEVKREVRNQRRF